MRPEPLWRRMARRPSWERTDPPRPSDFDPLAPVHALVNRLRFVVDRQSRTLRRLEEIERRRTRR